MWHLTRIHLDRIGAPAARFLDERLDFTDEFDRPLDSIVWLRNGGGKSTVLSLLCAHLRPKRTDFLAAGTTGKHLEDYVQSGDTSHTILEWVNENGERLITGAVYEWDGLQAPEDPAKNHDRLTSTWYCLTPPDDMRSGDLPRAGADGTPLRLKEYKAALRALSAHDVVVCDDQTRWGKQLDDRGMDPDLLTPILAMNATEGGIDGAFSYANPDAFIRYLLSLVADPASAASVAKTLEKVRLQLANRPRTLVDLTFATEAEPQLTALAARYDEHHVAASELASAQGDATELARSFAARVTATNQAATEHASKVAEADRMRASARSAREIASGTAAELRRIAAVLRRDAANAWHARSDADRRAAREHVAALGGLDRLAAQQQAQLRVEELAAQMRQQQQGAAPLADRRDAAARTLYLVLTHELDELATRASRRREQTATAQKDREAGRSAVAEARSELSALNTTSRQLRKTIAAMDVALLKARADGTLDQDESPAATQTRLVLADGSDSDRVTAIDDRRLQIESSQLACCADLVPARQGVAGTGAALTAARKELGALEQAVARLANDPAVNDLAQADQVDVLTEARELAATAATQVERHDRDRMRHAVETAEARRALAELEQSQLLPPDIDLERALGALAEAGIAATSGWRYLADNVPAERHPEVLAIAPSLVAGVAVHDPGQLIAARQILASAQLRPITAIGVGTTADLHAAATGSAAGTWVVQPARALTDRSEAEQETELRALEVSEADQREAALSAKREETATLAAALSALADTYDPADAQRLADQLTAAARDAELACDELAALELRERELQREDRALEAERRQLQERRRAMSRRFARLETLVEQGAQARAAHTELAGLPSLEAAQRERLSAGEVAEKGADTILRTLEAEDSQDDQTQLRMATRCDQLPASARAPASPGTRPAVPLAKAQDSYEQATLAYDQATSGSELAGTLRSAREQLVTYANGVSALPVPVRVAAQALLDSGIDPRQLPTLTSNALSKETIAETDLVEAKTELKLADSEVLATTPTDRPRHRVLDGPDPATRQEALDSAAAQDAARERALIEENAATEQVAQLTEQAKAHDQLVSDLTTLLTTLPTPTPALAISPAFPGDVQQAREQAGAATTALTAAVSKDARAQTLFDSQAKAIFLWANDPRFASVTEAMRSRFRNPDLAADLAPEAASLATVMAAAAGSLRAHLSELDEHQKTAVTAMRGMVRGAIKTLHRLQMASALPDTLPTWEGQKFLTVGPKRSMELTDAILDDRIGRVVEAMCTAGNEIPKGADLLWAATHAVVGDGNWTAKVLKPTVDGTIELSTVAQMRKWSGGEKVTANLLLFALAVKVRASERGRDHVGFGVLPLDNPLGKASYVPFLELQRKVAAAYGIQLLFLTGVADLRAVGRFPNIIRMANRSSLGRRYVGVIGRDVEPAAEGHLSHARIVRPDPIPGL